MFETMRKLTIAFLVTLPAGRELPPSALVMPPFRKNLISREAVTNSTRTQSGSKLHENILETHIYREKEGKYGV